MKSSNPKRVSIFISAFSTFVFIGLIGILIYFNNIGFNVYVLSLLILIVFCFNYLFALYVLRKFLYERIRIIYKNIHNFKVKKENFTPKLYSDNNIFEKINEDVNNWVSDKKLEIENLKDLEAYRREFLGNVSHELKTPITNIQGYVLTLLDGGLEDSKINRKYLLRTEKNIKRMIEIVEDLEEISKIESGSYKLTPIKFDLIELTNEVIEIFELKAREANNEIVLLIDTEKQIFVEADKENIRKVLSNLIDNAIKYGSEKGKTKISFFDMDEQILVEVTDNGIGIDEIHIPRLFERFYRIDKARTRDTGGSGLGLSIVKHILESHKQSIHVRSTVGIGTTFAFSLKKAKI